MSAIQLVLVVQVATFVYLGMRFLGLGDWRLGTAQLLLAAVQGIIYSGRME
jgi:hypothetical protein